MSIEQITKLLTDIEKDPSAWKANPDAVIARYDLADSEQAALRSGDTTALTGMGVDERITKMIRVK